MINICFHGIGAPRRELESDEGGYWISQDLYHRIVDEVAGRDDVALSFDDGNVSDIEIGLAPLLDTGRAADFFVLAGRFGKPGSLSPNEVRELQINGMRIGTHGMDHVPWRHLPAELRHRELAEARSAIAEVTGRPVTEAALPLGRYDRRLLRELRQRNYARVFTSDRRRARVGAWLQPRYSVHAHDTIETVRTEILRPPRATRALVSSVKGAVKRLR